MSGTLHGRRMIGCSSDSGSGLGSSGGECEARGGVAARAPGCGDDASAQAAPPLFTVLDTCVLISNVLRRILLGMAAQGRLQPVWSTVIGDEWRRNASRIWKVPLDDLQGQWAQMQQAFPLADQGDVESFKAGLRFSDVKDWHVIAAGRSALAASQGASVAVVTRNTRDFNRAELRKLGLHLMDPDRLLVEYWATDRELLLELVYDICEDAAQKDEAVTAMLKRERLFRFNKLLEAA